MSKEFGNPLYFEAFAGKIHPDYDKENIIRFLSRSPDLKNDPGFRTLLDSRNLVGVIPFPDGVDASFEVVIKEFRTMGFDTLKTLVTPSKAVKAWKGAAALLRSNIATPLPVAYFERKSLGLTRQSFFVSEWIKEGQEIRWHFQNLPDPEMLRLIKTLAKQAQNWHQNGILHRDLSDGNILVEKDDNNQFVLYLTDSNRIRVKKRIRLLKRIKNLIRLGIPSRFQKQFLLFYTNKAERLGKEWIWYRLNKQLFEAYLQFKKAIRIKKIVRKLRLQ